MLNIGHRGAKGHVAENTLASFQKALELGVDAIEFDVHQCASGEIVIIHDSTLERTTNGNGLVSDFTLPELKRLEINKQHKIPTLREALDLIDKRCVVNIELKGENTEKRTFEIIEEYVEEKNWSYDDFIVSSFNWDDLLKMHNRNPYIPFGVLTTTDLELAIGFGKFIYAKAIHPYFHLLTKENTIHMQEMGFKVFPWTVNIDEDIQKIKSFNVDGIITDFPNRI
jgi:glycerophosphoryl diester phosphodiesterase